MKHGTNWKTYGIYFLVVAVVVGGIGTAVVLGRGNNKVVTGCTKSGKQHDLQLTNDAFSPKSLTVDKCDTIVIHDKGKLSYDLNFGEHDAHIAYPGYNPTTLLPNESVTITAAKAGEFHLHDHFRDNAELQLTIRP